MATAVNIVLADGATTPANVTFGVAKATPEQSIFEDRSSGVQAFFRRLWVKTRRPTKADTNNRAQFVVELPVVVQENGVDVLKRTLTADVRLTLPDGSTDQDRKHLYAFLFNGLNNTLVRGALRDFDYLN